MTETNPIHPDVRRFAIKSGADKVRPMSSGGAGRVEYDNTHSTIIHAGENTDIPEGYQVNITFGPTPTIDLFPR